MQALTPEQAAQVEAHVGHVQSLARRLCRQWPQHIDVHDLEQTGHLGLIAAVQRYAPDRGTSVWTFAQPRVWGAMVDGLRRSSWPRGIRRDRALLADPLTAAWVGQTRRQEIERVESLASNAHGADLPPWVQGISPVPDPEAAVAAQETRARIQDALLTLPPRERHVLIQYYWRERTQLDIAGDLGVVECRIHQIRTSALARLLQALDPSPTPTESSMRRLIRIIPLVTLLLVAACGLRFPSYTPPSNPNPPAPIEQPAPAEPPASTVAILTVEVQGPPEAIVQVGDREWSTRRDHDGSIVIVEEFRAGAVLEVSARAAGYQASIPQRVTMTPGPMPRVVIRLEVPMVPPPDITTPVDQIPPAVWATVRRFVAASPWPRGDGSEAYIQSLRMWTRRLTEQLRHTHGPEWGHKSTSPSAPASKESIARLVNGDLHVWDMLIGAASGQPVLAGHPSHYHVNDQHFIHVNPVDHLASAEAPPARASIPQPWIGLTSFDLGVRLEAGDRRWVDMMAAEGFTVARVVVASVYRTPRTLADGLRQLPLTLSTLSSAGLRAEVVVLVDTRDYRMSRDAMRDHLRSVVAICDAQPAAVAGIHVCGAIEIANESTHGTQVEDLSDQSFLRELSALVPTRYPISWGSSHGGEAPYIGLGSYITHHADRDKSPEENAAIMAAAQRASGQLIIDDEALGIAEAARAGARTADPAYGERQARAARAYGLGGVTLHLEAGLTANVDVLGPVQREAIHRFVAAMREQAPALPMIEPMLLMAA